MVERRRNVMGWTRGAVISAAACVMAFVAAEGCSADGGADFEPTQEPAPTDTAQLPPASSSGGPTPDAGKPKDAGKDAVVDAGPPPPVPGTPCTKSNEIATKKCGACGTQSAICLPGGDAGADGGGALAWTEYSACAGELAGGCIPGTTETEGCGNCGTRTRTCTNACVFTLGACGGQPADSCTPGGYDFSSAGCTVAGAWRNRSCKPNCTWNSFSATCVAPPDSVDVAPNVGSVTTTLAVLTASTTIAKLSGTCPNATVTTTITPYAYVEVHNPLAKTATVSIYNSLAVGGAVFKTELAAYAGTVVPGDDAARKACVKGVATTGTAALTGDAKFASLDNTRVVTIAPGASVLVYVGAYYAYDATKPADSTGAVKLNVRTETLN
jgi:hypothetical protein